MSQDVKQDSFVSSSGTPFYTPIEYVYDDKFKCMVPIEGKKVNRYEMIQASAPSCDINYIVKRALAGDMSALNVKVPQYADVSEMPDNLNDLHNMNIQAINSFAQLDSNIRALFNNNVDTFIQAVNDGSYATVISNAFKPKDEVKSSESESVN